MSIVIGDYRDYMECPVKNKKGKPCVRYPASHSGPHKFKSGMQVVLVPEQDGPS